MNLLIDPYGIYGVELLQTKDFPRNAQYDNARMIKPHLVSQMKPSSIVIGTSRAEWGIPLNHSIWGTSSLNKFNLSLPGADISEIFDYLKFANRTQKLEKVIFGLDFYSFNALETEKVGFSKKRLEGGMSLLNEKVSSLLSIDTLIDSYATVTDKEVTGIYFDSLGQIVDDSIVVYLTRNRTRHDTFWTNVWLYLKRRYPDAQNKFKLHSFKGGKDKIEIFRQLLRYCYQNDIELFVFISPLHALQNQIIKEVGLWDTFEDWKKEIVYKYSQERQRAGLAQVPLWDFSDCNILSMEKVPNSMNKNHEMVNFWTADHYKKKLGNLVLNKLQKCTEISDQCLDNFGTPLFPKNIDSKLLEIRNRQSKYEKNHAFEISELLRFKQFIDNKVSIKN